MLLGCDMLCATGRKYLRGPRGTGFLYVRSAMLEQMEPPLLDLHAATWVAQGKFEVRGDAKKFETWESAAATAAGVGRRHRIRVGVGPGEDRAPGSGSGRPAAGAAGRGGGRDGAGPGPRSLRHCDLYLRGSFGRRSDAVAAGTTASRCERLSALRPASTWSSGGSMSW